MWMSAALTLVSVRMATVSTSLAAIAVSVTWDSHPLRMREPALVSLAHVCVYMCECTRVCSCVHRVRHAKCPFFFMMSQCTCSMLVSHFV